MAGVVERGGRTIDPKRPAGRPVFVANKNGVIWAARPLGRDARAGRRAACAHPPESGRKYPPIFISLAP